jgi:hypothetical protein
MNDRFNRIAYAGSTNVRFCIRIPITGYAGMIDPNDRLWHGTADFRSAAISSGTSGRGNRGDRL